MRVLTVLFMVYSLSAANRLLTTNDVEFLFKKFVQHTLTEQDVDTYKDTLEILRRPEYISEKSLETRNQARVSIDCLVCRSAFGALFQSVRAGQSDEDATSAIVTLCISLGIQSEHICRGAVALNMPIIAHIIRSTPEATPAAFCGLLLQSASQNACPFNDPRFEWEVELPPQTSPRTVSYDNIPLKVALITDAHIDPLYEAFGAADCGEPVCCRRGQTPRSSPSDKSNVNESLQEESLVQDNGEMKIDLSFAEQIRKLKKTAPTVAQSRQAEPAGFWGDYRNCDTPLWAYDDAIDHIYENHQDVDVIYYIGDTIDHGVWETSYDLINAMNLYIVEKIRSTFGDHVKVIPVIGNHEAQPTNQFAPSTVVGEKLNTTWLYAALVDKWGYYLTGEARQTFLEQGDFSLLIRPGLRVISLNNNVAYRDNWWLVYDPQDSKKHLDWLVMELYKAENAGERVHILAHIPPGVHDLTHVWTREYNRIVNRFSETIAAEFNGHTHADEFKVFYNPEGTPINVAWGGGGITSYTFYNLNYKIVTFDNSYMPDGITNYVYNLTEANLTPQQRPQWFQLYDMRTTFELTNLSAQSISNLIISMVTYNRRLLNLYSAFLSKVSDVRSPDCDTHCQIDSLCRTVITVLWERERCDELRDLFQGRL